MNQITEFNKKVKKINIINTVVFDTYKREIGRYGGEQLISLVEEIFFRDSMLCFEEISELDGADQVYKYQRIVKNSINYLLKLGLSVCKMHELFEISKTSINANKMYRKIKDKSPKFIAELLDICNNQMKITDDEIKQLSGRIAEFSLFRKREIYFSLLHMHFNRLSISNNEEEIFLEIIYKFLRHLVYLEGKKDGS